MLEALNLTKTFVGPPAVDSVSFTIRPGEILGYLGPNGAGKSTTVKMLTGLLEPTSGRVLFHGQDIRRDLKGFQRHLGYVPEEPYLYPHLSGREYLQLAGRLRGLPRRSLDPKMDELLRLIGLWDDRHASIASYSKGMRQKILLLAALLHEALPQLPCRFDHSNGPKTWNARNVLLLRPNGYSPEPCSGPPSRSLLSQAELCRASEWRSGSDRGCRLRFRCLLSGMPPRFPFSPQPVFAGLA